MNRKLCSYLGLDPGGDYFEEMVLADDDVDYALQQFLDDELPARSRERTLFHVYKTSYDKLVEKEISVPEIGELLPTNVVCCRTSRMTSNESLRYMSFHVRGQFRCHVNVLFQ